MRLLTDGDVVQLGESITQPWAGGGESARDKTRGCHLGGGETRGRWRWWLSGSGDEHQSPPRRDRRRHKGARGGPSAKGRKTAPTENSIHGSQPLPLLTRNMDGDDTVTAEVCKEADVGDGELWEVMVAGYPVLLVRNKKEFSALGSKCPHYGAPLSKGVLKGERLRCPWHGACFNIKTGDIEEYPSLDCLPRFKVTVKDGKVFVTAKKKDLESSLRVKDTSKRCLLNRDTKLLLGGGVAALTCAETLRQEGFTGRIIMATKEKHAPYDKSKLSKEMNLKAEDIYLRKPEFLNARGIELWTEKEAVSVDFQKQKVCFMDGSSQTYNQLLIATGSHSSFLKVPGADLQNVCILHTPEDSRKILELAPGKNLVIIGASFIGMEVAAFLSDKAGDISVVEKKEFPFQNALGPQVGGVAMKLLQNKGVKFYMKTELCELKGKDGKVTEAVLASGEKLPADVVVVGIGVFPNSAFLKGTSIARDDRGAILVDLRMQTNIPNVFAAGDVVSFPVALLNGDRSSIHHQQVAEAHGHVAALNMLKKEKELHTVPFFWTTMLGKSIRYAGCGKGYTDTVVKGSLEQQKFLIFYIKDGFVTAAASLNCDPMVSLIAEVLYLGKQISKEEAEACDICNIPSLAET